MNYIDALSEGRYNFIRKNLRYQEPEVLIINPIFYKSIVIELNGMVQGQQFDLSEKVCTDKFMGIRIVRSEDVKTFEFH